VLRLIEIELRRGRKLLFQDASLQVHAGQRLGIIGINGAAARLVEPDDLVIIASYVQVDEDAISAHCPRVVLVNERNRLCRDADRKTVT